APPMQRLFVLVRRVAPAKTSVLIAGESGTGKELVARALHHLSPRADQPFVAVNCGAIPDALLESELFGHVKGAFTGAHADKPGLFSSADGGTLLLDEIGELSPQMQVKLLRVLQERTVEPGERITRASLPELTPSKRHARAAADGGDGFPDEGVDLERVVADTERELIAKALERSHGVRKAAAKLLGISFRSLRYRLAKL